jgi:Flp pilus assembly protein TadG
VTPPDDERGGGPSVEAAIVAGVLGLVLTFGIATMRLSLAEATSDQAARAAARVASVQRNPAGATAEATDAARAVFQDRGIACARVDVATAADDGASVRATVRCEVDWSDLLLPGAPGTYVVEATAVSVVDRYREAS